MNRALLIVDTQNDFTEGGALGVAGGSALAAGVSALIQRHGDAYALIAASRDWHDATGDNGGHFAASGSAPNFKSTWPVHCVAGTAGAEYHPALALALDRIGVHLRKGMGRPAYSAFEGQTLDGQSLAQLLAEAGIQSIDIVGIATDYCVLASALDAAALGLQVRLLRQLVVGVAPESSAAAFKTMTDRGILMEDTWPPRAP